MPEAHPRTASAPDERAARRFAAERLRRIWQMVEDIAHLPGKSRAQLAREFALSERQIQSDLNVIRTEMALPLVRRQGYRFSSADADAGPPFSLAEAHLLLVLLRRATRDPAIPSDRLRSLTAKLPYLFPVYLRPLVVKTLESVNAGGSSKREATLATLADALLRKRYVKLHYPAGDPLHALHEPVVLPEVLFPHLSSWFVIGHCRQRSRRMIFDLDGVVAVTHASGL